MTVKKEFMETQNLQFKPSKAVQISYFVLGMLAFLFYFANFLGGVNYYNEESRGPSELKTLCARGDKADCISATQQAFYEEEINKVKKELFFASLIPLLILVSLIAARFIWRHKLFLILVIVAYSGSIIVYMILIYQGLNSIKFA